MLLCTVWDEDTFYIVNRKKRQVQNKIKHPDGDFKCWGISKMPSFDLNEFPYLLSRDDRGITLLDVKKFKAISLTVNNGAITQNLFGHGSILKVVQKRNG